MRADLLSALAGTFEGAVRLLRDARPAPIVLSYLLLVLCLFLGAVRWQLLLGGLGCAVRIRDTLSINFMCIFVNNIVPGRVTGELLRVGMLRARANVALAPGAASNGYDRVLDVVPLVCMMLLSLPLLWPLLGEALRRASALALRVAVLALAALLCGLFLLRWRLRRAGAAWQAHLRRQWDLLSSYRVPAAPLAAATACAFVLWFLDGARYWLIAWGLDVHLSAGRALVVAVAAALAGLLPSVGGIGAVEGGITAALVLFGVPLERALAITAVERIFSYGASNLVGGALLLLHGGAGALRAIRRARAPRAATAAPPGPDTPHPS